MSSELPNDIQQLLDDIDRFIDTEISPLQAENDNERFFDHRREWARTDFDAGGQIVFLRNGRPVIRETYVDVRPNAPVDDAVFDPARWADHVPPRP